MVCCSYDLRVCDYAHEMVGDIDRIVRYPARGFQIAHELPPRILESFRHLVEEGFDRHLLG